MAKIYIAGPMSGYPEFNFPAFNTAEYTLRREGWAVFNPARKDEEATLSAEAKATGDNTLAIKEGFNFRSVFTWDVCKVIEADAIFMLKGWEQSPGARAEHAVAVAMKKHYPDYIIMYES